MKSILVLCEGNICRSPMAQGLLTAALPEARVRSAGLGAMLGMPADDIAVRLMRERGIDITSHRALQLTGDLCRRSDLVLAMSTTQCKRVGELYPFAWGKVFRLGEFSDFDVPDPYRKPEAAFRDALKLIDQGVHEWLHRIHQI